MKDGDTVSMGGFGLGGIPENCVVAMVKKGVKDIKVVSNTAGVADWGLGLLFAQHQVDLLNASYVGENPIFEKQYLTGQISLNMIPQGSLAERCRIGAAGVSATYLKAGVSTYIESGGFPMRFGRDGKSIERVSKPKERRNFDGTEYLLEEAIKCDFSLVKAFQADKKGNLRFRKTSRNFNPDMAGIARVTVAEVEQIVDEIPADKIHLSGCFIDRIFKSPKVSGKIERLKLRDVPTSSASKSTTGKEKKAEKKDYKKLRIANRAVEELASGMYCNLGIGIPVMVANSIEGKVAVDLQGENGIVGIGPYPMKGKQDPDIINASKETITEAIGHSHNKSSDSFGMMRGLHLHLTMLGSMEVSQTGDIANWIIPGQKVKGMGGAMDLVSCGSKVIVTMEHCGPGNSHKLVKNCTLPLTAPGCVSRLITELVMPLLYKIK
jgi:3-oxoacid CoA-transferase